MPVNFERLHAEIAGVTSSDVPLDLTDDEMAERKRQANWRLHSREIPLYRLLGFLFTCVLMTLTPEAPVGSYAALVVTYSLASWAALKLYFRRCPFNLGVFFLYVDVLFYCGAIAVTGMEFSPLLFLLLVRVADQIPAGPRRTLSFAHFNVICYALTMWWFHDPASQYLALENTLIVYLTGLYLCLSALAAERLRQRASTALKSARQFIVERDEADQARNRFLANISHELRTPMNGVLGMLDLTMQTELNAQQKGYLTDARMSAQVLLRVLNDILDLIKLQSARFPLVPTDFAPAAVLEEVYGLFAERARAKGVRLSLRLPEGLPDQIRADRDRLCQVLLNLVDNAFKFTERGEVTLEVVLPQPDRLQVLVHDTGMGIAPDRLEQMFEPFVQADDTITRAHGGTGLGLSICRELAHVMGGELTARSQYGHGSTFVLELPLEVVRVDETSPQEAEEAAAAGLRVLVVEDNLVNQKVCTRMLEQLGHQAVVCQRGEDTLDALEADQFDLVLMDIQMPGIDGFEVTRRIRQTGSPIRIVALTAHAGDGYREFCLDQGMDGFLTKPLRLENLRAVL